MDSQLCKLVHGEEGGIKSVCGHTLQQKCPFIVVVGRILKNASSLPNQVASPNVMIPAISYCYMAQLTFREGDYLSGHNLGI